MTRKLAGSTLGGMLGAIIILAFPALASDREATSGKPAKKMMPAEHSVHDLGPCAMNGVALSGYDVVSYWDETIEARPQLGSEAITAEHAGFTYRFASTEHRDQFMAAPERYLPSYQGWCSTNLAMGRLACPDVTNFEIQDGRLLLFEQIGFSNGRDVWNLDAIGHRTAADGHFKRLLDEP